MKFKSFFFCFALLSAVLLFAQCAQTTSGTAASANVNKPIPAELKNSDLYKNFVGKKELVNFKVTDLPKSDFSLVYVAVPKDNPIGTDPAEVNAAMMFVFNNKSKQADAEKTKKINADLKSSSDDAQNCGGLASLDLNSFVANQGFVHLDQFFAPGMERTTCMTKIVWDEKKSEIVVQRIQTVTE